MNDELTERQRQRLADFDARLATLIEAPIDDAGMLHRVETRLRRRQRLRLAVPGIGALMFALLVGPTLWPVLQDVLAWSATGLLQLRPGSGDWLAMLAALPVYAWAVLAGVVMTIAATLLES